jgi:uncharacterized membrane protein
MAEQERDILHSRLDLLQRQLDELRYELHRIREEVTSRESGDLAAPLAPEVARPAAEPAAQPRTPPAQPPPGPSPKEAWQAAAAAERARKTIDLEFWLGGRGLLLLGVIAGVLAVGFFVKEAIERGWIGPATRVLLGAGIGTAAAIIGERIRARGYRIYGLWLAAGGFSAVYLSIWAATALYSLISSAVGFLLMVVVVAVAAALGLLRKSESFVALAAFGGYLAPILVQVESGANLFGLGYLGLLSAAGLWVGFRGRWAYLAGLAVAGGAILPIANQGDPGLHGVYLVLLVAAALIIARQRRWHYVSLLAVVFGWVAFWVGSGDWGIAGISYASFAAALWSANLIATLGIRDWVPAAGEAGQGIEETLVDRPVLRQDAGPLMAELTGLFLTLAPPWLFLLTAINGIENSVYSEWSGEVGSILALALGAAYVAQALWIGPGVGAGSRLWVAAAGLALWITAPRFLWGEIGVVRAWLFEGLVFTAYGVWQARLTARTAGLAAFVLAVLTYWGLAASRPLADPAFFSFFALTGLGTCVGLLAWSLALVRLERSESWEKGVRPFVLLGAAVFFLGWGTGEIFRFYDLLGEADRWTLARDLSISAFWMAYAAALLALGFRLKQAPVRWAGLGMALIAAGKVFLYDLSQLSQMYRIFSFVLLAIVLLALSYRYQRWRRT